MDIKAGEEVPQSYKDWFRADLRHAEEWRKEATKDYGFRDNHQWSDPDKQTLEDQGRMPATFNGILSIIDAVSGQEISNRQEVRYIPRVTGPPEEGGDQEVTDLYTSAAHWFRDRADADDNDTEAFRDTITGGMGWTETRLEYEDNPQGDLKDDRTDPFEMVWDHNARKQNLIDARRVWRVRQLPADDARAFAEGLGVKDVTAEDLNADWAAGAVWEPKTESGTHSEDPVRDRTAGKRGSDGQLTEVVIVHCQWIERETYWRLPSPETGQEVSLSDEDFGKLKKQADPAMLPMLEGIARKHRKKVRYQAILGSKVLKVMPCACPDHFNFKCITGKRDQITGQFYGLVRTMRDPQEWSNKLFSQILHIINSSAKGGIGAERGQAFDDDAEAEESWARTDRITWFKAGALSGAAPKWMAKPVAQVPPALQYLMETARTAIYQTSGVNLELLGQREVDQPGVLEYQRRQAGLTILQPYFDALKAYRREQGELILWYIKNDLSDDRLIRIVGKQEGQYVQLTKDSQAASLEYDIIVDDAPTSPNQKEKNWQLITQLLPTIKDILTPEVMLALAEDSPLPSSTVKKLAKLNEQASQGPMAELKQKMAMLEAAVLETKAKLQDAQATKAQADAQATMMEAGQGPDHGAELTLKAQETQGKLAIEGQKAAATVDLQRQKHAADIETANAKWQGEQALQAQNQAADQERQMMNAVQDAHLKAATAAADIAIKDRTAKAAARRPKPAKGK